MSNKLIVISDTHVKSRLWTNFAGIQGDAYEALNQISKLSREYSILSCGDLFDSNRPSSTDLDAVSNLCRGASVIYYINGNHDDCFPSILPSLTDKCVHLNSVNPVMFKNVNLFGIDWQNTRDKILEELSNIASNKEHIEHPERTVVIMHQSLNEFFAKGSPLSAADIWTTLNSTKSKVIIGDIHSKQLLKSPTEDGWILSPGPLVPQDIGQAKKQQFYHLLDTDKCMVKEYPVKVRDYVFVDGTDAGFDLSVCLSTIVNQNPLPTAVILTVKPNYILPKDIPDNFVVVTDVQFDRAKLSSVHTVETSIDEAVTAEIDSTETEGAKLMKTIYNNLKTTDTPDEMLDKLLTKWQVVLGLEYANNHSY